MITMRGIETTDGYGQICWFFQMIEKHILMKRQNVP